MFDFSNNFNPLYNYFYLLYEEYKKQLESQNFIDLSLLQRITYDFICENSNAQGVFEHLLIDEYQDTNVIQERLFLVWQIIIKTYVLLVMTIRLYIVFVGRHWVFH